LKGTGALQQEVTLSQARQKPDLQNAPDQRTILAAMLLPAWADLRRCDEWGGVVGFLYTHTHIHKILSLYKVLLLCQSRKVKTFNFEKF